MHFRRPQPRAGLGPAISAHENRFNLQAIIGTDTRWSWSGTLVPRASRPQRPRNRNGHSIDGGQWQLHAANYLQIVRIIFVLVDVIALQTNNINQHKITSKCVRGLGVAPRRLRDWGKVVDLG